MKSKRVVREGRELVGSTELSARYEHHLGTLAVPLIDEPNQINIQIAALNGYRVDRSIGLELLEPLAEVGEGRNDPRLDASSAQRREGEEPHGD